MPEIPTLYRWLLLSGVWGLYTTFGLVATSLAPLVGLIEAELHLSHTQMGTIMGAWQLVYIFSAIPCGILIDRMGSRWALSIGGILISLSAFTRGTADSFLELLIAVMLFGLGGPLISAGAPAVVATSFKGSTRGLAMGIYATGPAIGGIIVLTTTHSAILPALDHSWRTVMTLWAAVGTAAVMSWLLVTNSPQMNPINKPPGKDALPQFTIIKSLIKQPAVLVVLFMSIGVFMINHGLNNWLPELLRAHGMSLTRAGYWAAIPTVIGLAGSLIIPRLATPARRFDILIGLSLLAALATILLHFSSDTFLFTGLVFQGIARSSLMTVLVLTLVEIPGIGEKHIGVASGLFFSAAEVGGLLGPLGQGVLYDLTLGFDAGLYLLTLTAMLIGLGAYKLKVLSQTYTEPCHNMS